MLTVAGMNALLMLPAWFFLNARLPPRQPLPLRALLKLRTEGRYIFLVVGSSIVMMKYDQMEFIFSEGPDC